MSSNAIVPSAVYPPVRPSGQVSTGRQRFYQTYNTRYINQQTPVGGGNAGNSGGGGFNYGNSRVYNAFQRLPQGSVRVNLPRGVPSFLGARPVLLFAWMAALGMVAFDEWHRFGILPRPARLWYTSLTFFLLGIASIADILVPLVNAMAIGLVIALGYEYYTGGITSASPLPGIGGASPGSPTSAPQSGTDIRGVNQPSSQTNPNQPPGVGL